MNDSNNSAGESQQGTIYKILCLVTGKPYVGKTKQKLERRISGHKSKSKKANFGVDAAIRKYGWENFKVEILEVCPVEKLNEREIFWIANLNSKSPHGYNLTDGGESRSGENHPFYGKHHTKEACARIANAKKGKKHTAETRAKMSANHADVSGKNNPNYGKHRSVETKAKISANQPDLKGEKNPMYGKHHSAESKAKISAKNSGENNPNYGKHRPPETCAKIAAKRKAWWAKKKLENGGNK